MHDHICYFSIIYILISYYFHSFSVYFNFSFSHFMFLKFLLLFKIILKFIFYLISASFQWLLVSVSNNSTASNVVVIVAHNSRLIVWQALHNCFPFSLDLVGSRPIFARENVSNFCQPHVIITGVLNNLACHICILSFGNGDVSLSGVVEVAHFVLKTHINCSFFCFTGVIQCVKCAKA